MVAKMKVVNLKWVPYQHGFMVRLRSIATNFGEADAQWVNDLKFTTDVLTLSEIEVSTIPLISVPEKMMAVKITHYNGRFWE